MSYRSLAVTLGILVSVGIPPGDTQGTLALSNGSGSVSHALFELNARITTLMNAEIVSAVDRNGLAVTVAGIPSVICRICFQEWPDFPPDLWTDYGEECDFLDLNYSSCDDLTEHFEGLCDEGGYYESRFSGLSQTEWDNLWASDACENNPCTDPHLAHEFEIAVAMADARDIDGFNSAVRRAEGNIYINLERRSLQALGCDKSVVYNYGLGELADFLSLR